MKISSEQMNAFQQVAASDFDARLASFLREHFDDARQMPDAELEQGIRQQVLRAERYGLDTERQTASYVSAAWLLGPDFDENFPRIRAMLRSPIFGPDEKADFLLDHAADLFDALGGAR